MILVYLKDGECLELEAAIKAEVRDDKLFCFDDKDVIVGAFLTADVETYTSNPAIIDVMEDEICEDVVTVPAHPAPDPRRPDSSPA